MSIVSESLNDSQRAQFLEAARVAGLWFANNQNAPHQRWGDVDESADEGRFLYEYFPATGQCRGAGVWSQALATASLLCLGRVKGLEKAGAFAQHAEWGAGYLCSLQFLDNRYPKSYGAFREQTPQTPWGSCRDAATGCFGLATLHKFTEKADYLDRANLFCQWYSRYGSDDGTWPYRFFDHETAEGREGIHGDWQAGGALAYYYTAKTAGDERWLNDGLKPVAEQLLTVGDPSDVDGRSAGWHGQSRITVGNDDFATITALAAFLAFDDQRYLDLARKRIKWMMSLQAESGAFPNYGGTFVTALTLLDFVEIAHARKLRDDTAPMVDALLRAAQFGLSLQENGHADRRAYGGLYGQSNYGVGRDRIHNRSTNYAIHLWLRLAGQEAPCLSALGW